MIRLAFLRRMAFAAMACGFFDLRTVEVESEEEMVEWWEVERMVLEHGGYRVERIAFDPIRRKVMWSHDEDPTSWTVRP